MMKVLHQRRGGISTYTIAQLKDAHIKLREEECALGMGQRLSDAAVKDVQNMLRMKEFALRMEQSANDAELKDAQVNVSKEDCAMVMIYNIGSTTTTTTIHP